MTFYPHSKGVLRDGQEQHDLPYVLDAKYIPKSALEKRNIAVRIIVKSWKVVDGTTYLIPAKGGIKVQSFPDDDGL